MHDTESERALQELHAMIREAKAVPMSSSAMVNRSDALSLIERAIDAVRDALAESKRIVADRDAELHRGREEGNQIRMEAEEWAEQMASQTEIVHRAQSRADQLVREAQTESDALRTETDQYVDTRMAEFEAQLSKVSAQVRTMRERLSDRTQIGHMDDSAPLPKL